MIATNETWTIRLASVTRVEGEGGLRIEVRDGHLRDVKVEVFEAPRFFEASCVAAQCAKSLTLRPASAASVRPHTR